MKQRKTIKNVLVVFGIILILSALRSVYYTYEEGKKYELMGWSKVDATCIQETSYTTRTSSNDKIWHYKRMYSYVVSGQKYTLNVDDFNTRPLKAIVYNPNNPYEAKTYEGINTETIVVFFVGLICIFSPYILKHINIKKIDQLKCKILKMSKRNIIKNITVCFFVYLGISLIVLLKEIFFKLNWRQIVTTYSPVEIFVECTVYIIGRNNFKKFTSYFNIFGI